MTRKSVLIPKDPHVGSATCRLFHLGLICPCPCIFTLIMHAGHAPDFTMMPVAVIVVRIVDPNLTTYLLPSVNAFLNLVRLLTLL